MIKYIIHKTYVLLFKYRVFIVKIWLYDFGSQCQIKNKSLYVRSSDMDNNLTVAFNYYIVIKLKLNTGRYTPTSELYTNKSAIQKTCAKLSTTVNTIIIAGGQ